jgi:pimeloyl-ACP methyl ester carboxylesterase
VNETVALKPSPGVHTSFAPLKQVDAGVLNVGYAEAGPGDGPSVLLLHGWPFDIYSYVDVAPILASAGYRVIVPFLRGYGTTRFLSGDTFRSGEQAALGADAIALMDALGIEKAIFAGYDWGGRAACVVSALWPDRCKGLVSVTGYSILNPKIYQHPAPPKAEWGIWSQFYLCTERGRLGYSEYRHDFNKLLWKLASPKWDFDDATYDRSAVAFDNPDHVDIVVHSYRWRLNETKGDPKYGDLESRLERAPVISVPTITIASDFDGANASGISYRKQFAGAYSHRILDGIGHDVPQEAPEAFSRAIIDVDGY